MQVVNALVKIISAIPIISNADVIPARNEGRFAVGSILGGEAFSCLPISEEGEENGFTSREPRGVRHVVEDLQLESSCDCGGIVLDESPRFLVMDFPESLERVRWGAKRIQKL